MSFLSFPLSGKIENEKRNKEENGFLISIPPNIIYFSYFPAKKPKDFNK